MKLDEQTQSDIAHSPELQTIKHALGALREEYDVEPGEEDQFLKTIFLLINDDKKLVSESVKYLDQFL